MKNNRNSCQAAHELLRADQSPAALVCTTYTTSYCKGSNLFLDTTGYPQMHLDTRAQTPIKLHDDQHFDTLPQVQQPTWLLLAPRDLADSDVERCFQSRSRKVKQIAASTSVLFVNIDVSDRELVTTT